MLLLLLLPLLQGAECVGGPGVQAGAGSSQRPQAPDEEFRLQVQRSVTVHEGLCVFIPCNFSYSRSGWQDTDPAYGYWYHKQVRVTHHQQDVLVATNDPAHKVPGATEGRFQLLGDPGAKTCSLGITDARKEDGGKYFFRLERGKTLKYSYKMKLTVNVAAARLVPISITGSLDSGHRSNVTCSVPSACDRGTPLAFSWAGPALRSQEPHQGASNFSVVTLTPGPQDHGTNLTCRVTFPRLRVTAERTITLNVSYAPQNLTIGLLRGECTTWKYLDYLGDNRSLGVLEGDSLRLVCVADSNPPASLSWVPGRRALSPSAASGPGLLELSRVREEDEGEVTCRAENPLGVQQVSLHLSVLYPPRLLGPFCSWEPEGLRCSCSVRARPAATLRWWLGTQLVEATGPNASVTVTSSSDRTWANSSLSVRAGFSPDLALHCEARNAHGTHSLTILPLPGEPECAGFVQAATLGAGLAAALFLCACLIFLGVKTCRKKTTKMAGPDVRSVMGTVTQRDPRKAPPRGPAPATSISGEVQMPGPEGTGSPAVPGMEAQDSELLYSSLAETEAMEVQGSGMQCPSLPEAQDPEPEDPEPEDPELHYAALVFPRQGPRGPQCQEEASCTEYAEIAIRK
ncbi:sialic acid-binding Ig-like lectin 5 [Tenrec ecaudatus]|uniref:sialic acid-binding Ig-like lectin 5 n=1 Tax=Tenrec ecaudatus TaxID=94439 RepID=UPI003F5988B7